METLSALLGGFGTALSPANLLWALIGVTLGTLVGVLSSPSPGPGLGPALTVALLLPVTARLPPVSAFIMFAGVYYGGMSWDSAASSLRDTPREAAPPIPALEGHRRARRGRAAALATAATGSFVAGIIAATLLTLVTPAIARVAVTMPASASFMLILLVFVMVSATFTRSPLRGLISLFLGLTIALIGADPQGGPPRFTLGRPELLDGIDFSTVVIGLLAVGETLYVASRPGRVQDGFRLRGGGAMTRGDWRRSWNPWLRGAVLGFPLGALATGDADLPTRLSLTLERRLGRHPEASGGSVIEDVAGPGAANAASVAGVLLPLLTLGLPTSATAAILLAAFQQYDLQPGPLLFVTNATLVWALIASLYIGSALLLLNLPLAAVWARLASIPRAYLYAGILVLSTVGVYSLNNSVFDLFLLAVFGVVGFLMRRFDLPLTPAIIGVVLGPTAEGLVRTALQQSGGQVGLLVRQPLTALLLLGVALALALPPVLGRRTRRRG
ncbi:tripartite tricarboxylate transporter permease [Deinococcus koreensis]|uniref:Tripartite tricarboxylate transporter TctA n=1 Tax=Deinococcus koreensis TaxID=2054903 RepID=A0A2K3V2T9_9DEIO|nr:tripartite tricarboxylate transporter permease [Deinococcus koreensis]PNY83107.1 tripartite tricarboxylate transporter TctA [Deinococcus koreensis]